MTDPGLTLFHAPASKEWAVFFGRDFAGSKMNIFFRGKEKMLITYEYECSFCELQFEFDQAIRDEPLSKCPNCGEKPTRLISGGSGFIWKGGDNGPGRFTTPLSSKLSESACSGKSKTCDKKAAKPKAGKKPCKKSG